MENVKGPISVCEEGIFQQLLFSPVSQLNHLWSGQCHIFCSLDSSKALPSHGGCFGDAPGQVLGIGTISAVRVMSKYP